MFVYVISGVTSSDVDDFYLYPTLQVGVSIDLENLLWLSFLTVSHFLWCSPFSDHRFSTALPLLCPKAINRKQNFVKWNKKSYLLPYQSPLSRVTLTRTWGRWHWSVLSCGADAGAVSQIYNQVVFLRSLPLGSESYPLNFCRKVKVTWCCSLFWVGTISWGNVLHSIRGSVPPSRANKYQNE